MNLHAFAEYLRYLWQAKGRHGTHSPFVYSFVEQVLMDKGVIDKAYLVSYPSLPLKYENLVSRIAAHFKYRDILLLPQENEGVKPSNVGMLLLRETKPLEWVNELDRHYSLLQNNSAVIVPGIHHTPLHTKAWGQLCKDPRVRMSIDLYGIGILLFREEFKEQQHFILKY